VLSDDVVEDRRTVGWPIRLVFSGAELPYVCLERQMAVSMAVMVSGSQMHVVEGEAEEYPKKTCMACATRTR
jgi:hypothetical protein